MSTSIEAWFTKIINAFLEFLGARIINVLETVKTHKKVTAFFTGVLLIFALYSMLFTVDTTEYGLVKRFGKIVKVLETPGLKIKFPYPIDRVQKITHRLLSFQPPTVEYLTQSKNHIAVSSVVLWRIQEPRKFVETMGNRVNAEIRLTDIVASEIGSTFGTYPLSALVAKKPQELEDKESKAEESKAGEFQFGAILSQILGSVRENARDYGIEVVDVRLTALNFPEQNKRSVFERMIAERGRIATKFRSEGEMESLRIIAEAEREKTKILADAYKQAETYRAEGDAEAMKIYAGAFQSNPEFYKFLRTLEAYEKIFDARTTIFFPANADVLKLLNNQDVAKPATKEEKAVEIPSN